MNSVDKKIKDRGTQIRIARDMAAVSITKWALPTIVLLFAGLVGSIIYIEDTAMIAIIASATSSTSMALIGILNAITGHREKEDPMTILMKEQASTIRELMKEKTKSQSIRLGEKEVSLTEGSTNIHVSDDDTVWGKEKPLKDE